MNRLALTTIAIALLTACDDGASYDDVEAIAANKVEVCHFNNGSYGYTVIDVSESSLSSHLDHCDTLYADDPDCTGLSEGLRDWLPTCADTYGFDLVPECGDGSLDAHLEEVYADLNPGTPYAFSEFACFCDAGFCADCGTLSNPAACKSF